MEMIIPISGARKIKAIVFSIFALSIISFSGIHPLCWMKACVMAAPANPPISVWEEEDGIPYHQVNRFQVMAAINPAKITGRNLPQILKKAL